MLSSLIIDVPKYCEHHELGISEIDIGPLVSEKGLDKIKKRFERSPFKFNFIICTSNNGKGLTYISNSLFHSAKIKKVESYLVGVEIPNHITMVITNNATTKHNYVPLTSWMLVHRLSHAASQDLTCGNTKFDAYDYAVRIAVRRIHSALYCYSQETAVETMLYDTTKLSKEDCKDMKGIGISHEDKVHSFRADGAYIPRGHFLQYKRVRELDVSMMRDVMYSLFIMKSVRIKKLNGFVDIGAECLAQYVMTGKVILNRLENWNEAVLKNPWIHIHTSHDRERVNNLIARYEKAINRACESSLNAMVGNVFQF